MSDYIIEGGRKLEGEVEISGSKKCSITYYCGYYFKWRENDTI